ncbi:MAG: PSD1 and planctomycete cytochrome C domain-containing protein [Fuerstiella sp.]
MNRIRNLIPGFLSVAAVCLALALGQLVVAQDAVETTAEEQFFVDQIQPLLKRHCYECHSHDAGEFGGGLSLDSKSGWQKGGDHGAAVVPEKPDDSLLIKAVRRESEDLQMPPDERLPKKSVALLVEWIEQGAVDPRKPVTQSEPTSDPLDWWSLRPLPAATVAADIGDFGYIADHGAKTADLDRAPHRQSPQASIDFFVDRQLKRAELTPILPADRRTLIRRAYFDLHGLPPTPDEVDAFENDDSPDAWGKLVDRLLASPLYGERWARHWLDTVHFADTHGCEHDVFRPNAWRYRDYVIDSFNRDTSWPRFIREQLAADHFFPEESHLIAALGFIAAGPLELSRASTAPVTFDYLDRDDMVTQTMAAFASSTANCARCHDHKFDPITQEDYYSLQAVFAGIGKGDVEFDADPAIASQRRHYTALIDQANRGQFDSSLSDEVASIASGWEDLASKHPAVWTTLRPSAFVSSDGATLKRLEDDSLLASGHRPDTDTYTISAPLPLTKLSAVRLEVLPDESLPFKGPGRCDNGNLHLNEVEIYLNDSESRRLKIRGAVADWDQAGWTIAHSLDSDVKTAWGIYPKVGEAHHAVFEFEAAATLKSDSQITVVLKQLHGGSHLIGRCRLYVTDADGAAAKVVPQAVAAALRVSKPERTAEQQAAVISFAVKSVAEQKLAELPALSSVYAASKFYSRSAKLAQPMTPNVVHVLHRGSIDKPGAVAGPGSLSVITALPGRFAVSDAADEMLRRAALAEWLAAPENPLTWRSVVNRVWAYHFGRGICDTPNDFGRMGGTPSHPELLDWLAVWFRDDAKGSVKELHRLILMSQTYQRKSGLHGESEAGAADKARNVDPNNRLLWRMQRRSLDAESFRDALLQISGRIDLAMYGPGIQQFTQSKGAQATPKLDYDAFDWKSAAAARRSIYRVVWRGIADPFMESLDFPDLGLLTPQRGNSVSALQALTTFNNDFVLHHSEVLADKLTSEYPKVDEQIRQACRLIYLREPTANERQLLAEYANTHGLAATCRILFNSNEFLFVN